MFVVLMGFALHFGYSASDAVAANTYISDLTWISATNGWNGAPKLDKANGDPGVPLKPITLNGTVYAKGIGCHAQSVISYNLAGNYTSFVSDIGIDDEVLAAGGGGSVEFQVWGDGKKLYDSGSPYITSGQPSQHVNVSIAGVNTLQLIVLIGSYKSNDHADWAGAQLVPVSPRPLAGASGVIESDGTVSESTGNFNVLHIGTGVYLIIPLCPDGTQTCYRYGQQPAACTCTTAANPIVCFAYPFVYGTQIYQPTTQAYTYMLAFYPLTTLLTTADAPFQFTCGQ